MSDQQHSYMESGFLEDLRETKIERLTVEGDLPDWLQGSLIRNGPGRVNADKPMQHWFDGLAMLHKFTFSNGQVDYLSRFLDCKAYRSIEETGKMTYADFATDPCRSFFQKILSVFDPEPKITDSAKVNIGQIDGKTYALGEPLMQVEFDPETLESVGVFHYGMNPRKGMTTAHPHFSQDEAYNLIVKYSAISAYQIYSLRQGC